MKVFVTGGAGYVGSALVKSLLGQKIASEVTVYDNFSNGGQAFLATNGLSKIKFIKADILDNRSLKKAMDGHDAVVHLAECKNQALPHYLEQVNHWGTAEVSYAVESLKIKKMIFLSTTKVYPYTSSTEIISDFTTAPSSAYGFSKLRAEGHVERFFSKTDFNTHIIRAASTYGHSPGLNYDSFLNKLLLDAHYFNRIELFGTGFQERSFVHIENVIAAIEGLLTNQVESQVHNLSDRFMSVIDVIDELKQIYADMEFIFTSHHFTPPSIRVKSSEVISKFVKNSESLANTFKDMSKEFSK